MVCSPSEWRQLVGEGVGLLVEKMKEKSIHWMGFFAVGQCSPVPHHKCFQNQTQFDSVQHSDCWEDLKWLVEWFGLRWSEVLFQGPGSKGLLLLAVLLFLVADVLCNKWASRSQWRALQKGQVQCQIESRIEQGRGCLAGEAHDPQSSERNELTNVKVLDLTATVVFPLASGPAL